MNGIAALLWTVAGILLVLWILGLAFSTTFGGLIHLLLVVVLVSVVIGFFTRGRA